MELPRIKAKYGTMTSARQAMPTGRQVCLLITQGHWGGAQRYVYEQARAYRNEHDVVVAVGDVRTDHDLQDKILHSQELPAAHSLTLAQLCHLRREISLWHDIAALFEIRKLVRREHIALLHCNSAKAVVIGAIATIGLNCRTIATIHGWTSLEPLSAPRRLLYRALEWLATRLTDLIILPDKKSAHVARNIYHVPEEKIRIVPHHIEPPEFLSRDEARRELASRTGQSLFATTRVIGTIANLYPTKNLELLLQSFAIATHHMPDSICIIIGDGPERHNLMRLRDASPLCKKIFFLGSIPDAAHLLKGFDVFCLSSVKEGCPYVLLEARAADIPIVSTDVGGCPEILSGYARATLLHNPNTHECSEAIIRTLRA